MLNQYTVSNTKSNYFGLTVYELEQHKDKLYNETWIKVVFDFVDHTGNFKEVSTWFRKSELTPI